MAGGSFAYAQNDKRRNEETTGKPAAVTKLSLELLADSEYNKLVKQEYYAEREGIKMLEDCTRKFNIELELKKERRVILTEVYNALIEKGYDPISQIVGYLLSEDPGYITNHKNARSLIRKIDRDELLQELVEGYISR